MALPSKSDNPNPANTRCLRVSNQGWTPNISREINPSNPHILIFSPHLIILVLSDYSPPLRFLNTLLSTVRLRFENGL